MAHDIFVSYAHADDEVPIGAPSGWVTTLVGGMQTVLRRKLGGSGAAVYMDHQLAVNQQVTDTLLGAVRDSQVLVLVMSPGYQKSVWCQREMGNFLQASACRHSAENVFIIELEPVDRQSWHPALREFTPIPFWHKSLQDPYPRLMGFPIPKADEDSPYWSRVNELAHGIFLKLQRGGGESIAPRPPVWVGETTDDLIEEREDLIGALRQHGFDVLPAAPYPVEGEAVYLAALRKDLERAVLAVQLLGPREGRLPAWAQSSLVALQAEEAAAAAARRGIRLLRWRPLHVDPAAAKNPLYGELLRGENVTASGIEEFRQMVLKALATSEPAPAAPAAVTAALAAAPAPDNDAPPLVLVQADPLDQDFALRVQDSLFELDVETILAAEPSPDHSPEENRRAQEEQLKDCNAVVLVYGRAPAATIRARYAFAARTMAQRGRGVWGALVDGPPGDKPDHGVRGRGIHTLNCRDGLDGEALQGFVKAIRGDCRSV
jgi:hypothetical protein